MPATFSVQETNPLDPPTASTLTHWTHPLPLHSLIGPTHCLYTHSLDPPTASTLTYWTHKLPLHSLIGPTHCLYVHSLIGPTHCLYTHSLNPPTASTFTHWTRSLPLHTRPTHSAIMSVPTHRPQTSGSLDLGRVESLENEIDAQSLAVGVLQLVLMAIRPIVIAKSIEQHFILELMIITNYVKMWTIMIFMEWLMTFIAEHTMMHNPTLQKGLSKSNSFFHISCLPCLDQPVNKFTEQSSTIHTSILV